MIDPKAETEALRAFVAGAAPDGMEVAVLWFDSSKTEVCVDVWLNDPPSLAGGGFRGYTRCSWKVPTRAYDRFREQVRLAAWLKVSDVWWVDDLARSACPTTA